MNINNIETSNIETLNIGHRTSDTGLELGWIYLYSIQYSPVYRLMMNIISWTDYKSGSIKSINKNYRFICYVMLFIIIRYQILLTLLHFLSISFFSFLSYFPYPPYPIHIFSFLLISYTHPSHRFHLSHSSYPSHPVHYSVSS